MENVYALPNGSAAALSNGASTVIIELLLASRILCPSGKVPKKTPPSSSAAATARDIEVPRGPRGKHVDQSAFDVVVVPLDVGARSRGALGDRDARGYPRSGASVVMVGGVPRHC
jgi:hypothetical protein